MRTKSGEKEQLKKEILKDSVKTFKKYGQAGAPVDQIMKRAGLTSGALYSHFKGKDDLFNQAVLFEMDQLLENYKEIISKDKVNGLKTIVENYMTVAHVDNVEIGCLFSSLSPDLHRSKTSKRSDYETKFLAIIEVMASGLRKGTEDEKLKKAKIIYSIMLGSVSASRSLTSKEEIVEFLELGKSQIFELMK